MSDPKLTLEELDRLDAVEKAGYPGKWVVHEEVPKSLTAPAVDPDLNILGIGVDDRAIVSERENHALILEARNNFQELLRGYREWLRVRAKLTEVAETYRAGGGPGIMAKAFEDIRDNKA